MEGRLVITRVFRGTGEVPANEIGVFFEGVMRCLKTRQRSQLCNTVNVLTIIDLFTLKWLILCHGTPTSIFKNECARITHTRTHPKTALCSWCHQSEYLIVFTVQTRGLTSSFLKGQIVKALGFVGQSPGVHEGTYIIMQKHKNCPCFQDLKKKNPGARFGLWVRPALYSRTIT